MGTDNKNFGNNLTRRQFVLSGGAFAFASLLPNAGLGSLASSRRLPMLQTWAYEDRAQVTVLAAAELTFEFIQGSGRITNQSVKSLSGKDRVLYYLELSELSVETHSMLIARNLNGVIVDRRWIKGLNPLIEKPGIAVMSCSSVAHLKKQKAIWDEVPKIRPDLILFSGDIVYANSKLSSVTREPEKPSKALDRYIQTWEAVDLYQMETLIPLLAVWDDHDYGMNNGDSSHPYKEEMKEIYRSFYPLPRNEESLLHGAGVSFRVHLFGMDLYFLDNRSFAESGKTMWGDIQESWFSRDYSNRAFPAWIVNGTCFFKHTRWIESVEKFARASLDRFASVLRRAGKPCALFSGDIHASQVQKIPTGIFGFATYELTSSAMHSTDARFVHRRSEEDGQILYEGTQNFLFMKVQASIEKMLLEVTCVQPGTKRRLRPVLEIKASK